MRSIIIAAVVAACPFAAGAQVEQGCSDIANSDERLACYDSANGRQSDTSGETNQATANDTIPDPENWRLNIEQSEMTDDTNVFLSVESDTPVYCPWGGGNLTLTARCRENTTSLIISGDCHMTSSPYHDWGHVTYRLDDASPATWRMDAATNNRALGLWSGGQAIPQIRRMLGADTLRVRVRPYGQNAVETTFNIEGLDDLIGPLRRACHW